MQSFDKLVHNYVAVRVVHDGNRLSRNLFGFKYICTLQQFNLTSQHCRSVCLILVDFTKTSNSVAISSSDKTLDDVSSEFQCAALCRKENTFDCRSFDYCPSAKKCQLSKQHAANSGPATTASDICDHYSSRALILASSVIVHN